MVNSKLKNNVSNLHKKQIRSLLTMKRTSDMNIMFKSKNTAKSSVYFKLMFSEYFLRFFRPLAKYNM